MPDGGTKELRPQRNHLMEHVKPFPLETGAQVAVVLPSLTFRARCCCCDEGNVVRGSHTAVSVSGCHRDTGEVRMVGLQISHPPNLQLRHKTITHKHLYRHWKSKPKSLLFTGNLHVNGTYTKSDMRLPLSPKVLPNLNLTGDTSTPVSPHSSARTPEAGRRFRSEGRMSYYHCINNTTGLIKNAPAHGFLYANHVSRK